MGHPLAPVSVAPLDPASLQRHYARFGVAGRLRLTGHSHQAWPDVSFEAQKRAWLDAADAADLKWTRAEAVAARFRAGLAERLDDPDGEYALGQNTHELVVRLLSALDLRARPRLVSTDGEFHSLRRQLDRLAEAGLEVVKVPALPADGLAERLCAALDDRTAAVLVSAVLFRNAHIVPGLGRVADACERRGATLLVDAYHAVNAVPFSVRGEGLETAFVVGGGY
ncbi:MAG: kynureninase, partial [Gemmatimonadetes bacterium]